MLLTRIFCIYCISASAFAAIPLPKAPPAPTIPKNALKLNIDQKLPNLKAPYFDTSKASAKAKAYVFKLKEKYTLANAKKLILQYQAKKVPSYYQINKDKTVSVIIGPDLLKENLKTFITKVHIRPETGNILNLNVYNSGKTT